MNDDALLTELGDLLRRCDPVPERVYRDAVEAFALAQVPDGWRILEPLDDLALVRAAGRALRFGDDEITVEVELRRLPWRVELAGLVSPRAQIEDVTVAGVRVVPDAAGYFRVADLPSGPVRVAVHRPGRETVATRWFLS
jgi:hypothetical protein